MCFRFVADAVEQGHRSGWPTEGLQCPRSFDSLSLLLRSFVLPLWSRRLVLFFFHPVFANFGVCRVCNTIDQSSLLVVAILFAYVAGTRVLEREVIIETGGEKAKTVTNVLPRSKMLSSVDDAIVVDSFD